MFFKIANEDRSRSYERSFVDKHRDQYSYDRSYWRERIHHRSPSPIYHNNDDRSYGSPIFYRNRSRSPYYQRDPRSLSPYSRRRSVSPGYRHRYSPSSSPSPMIRSRGRSPLPGYQQYVPAPGPRRRYRSPSPRYSYRSPSPRHSYRSPSPRRRHPSPRSSYRSRSPIYRRRSPHRQRASPSYEPMTLNKEKERSKKETTSKENPVSRNNDTFINLAKEKKRGSSVLEPICIDLVESRNQSPKVNIARNVVEEVKKIVEEVLKKKAICGKSTI